MDSQALAFETAWSAPFSDRLGSVPLRFAVTMAAQDITPWTPAAVLRSVFLAIPRQPQPALAAIRITREPRD